MTLTKLKKYLLTFLHDLRGAVAIIVAIALPVVLSIAILAIDYSMALITRAENQRTADLAVYAAALTYGQVLSEGQNPLTAAQAEAAHLLELNGADPGDLTLTLLPEDEEEAQLEVVIAQDLPPIGLISLRGEDNLRVVVRSVARVGVIPTEDAVCMYTTGTQSGDFRFGNNATLLLNGCSIQSRGGFSNLPRTSQLNIGGCITQDGKVAPSECPSVKRKDLAGDENANPLGVEWADAEAECVRLGRPSTNLNSFRNGTPIPTGIHCITQNLSTNGGTYISESNNDPELSGVTLFFKPEVEVTIAGNPTFTLGPAGKVDIPTSSGTKTVRNVLFYGPEASLTARGTMSITSLGCYGITMEKIDFNGNPEISLSNSADSICDPERDLGIFAGVNVRLLE